MAAGTGVMTRVEGRDAAVLGGGLLAVALTAALLRSLPQVAPTTVGLALLLVVLITATFARLSIAIVVAIVATLGLNYFFFPPIGTLTIADPQNWVAVVAFLVTAVIASHLSATAQSRTREAIARRNEVTRLFDLSRDVLLTTETTGVLDALARHIARRFELGSVAIYLPSDGRWRVHQGGETAIVVDERQLDTTLAMARGTLEYDARQRAYGGHASGVDAAGRPVRLIPLRHGTRAIGVLLVGGETLELGTLDAIAGVAAIAIERAQFLVEREAAI